jgi:lipopolysaccharide transport system ATP-binding protein
MFVRLGFSVAAHLNPEVLIVDEVLAVGDVAFQRKCLGKMNEVSRGGRTVLFVSHNLAAVERLCQRALVLQKGRLEFEGTAQAAIDLYLRDVGEPETAAESHAADLRNAPGRPSQCRPLLQRLELFTGDGQPLNASLPIGAGLRAHVYFRLEQPTADFDVCLGFDSLLGQRILTAHSVFEPKRTHEPRAGEQVYICEIPSLTLTPGQYKLKVGLNLSNKEVDTVEDAARIRIAQTDYYGTGRVPWNGTLVLEHHWYLQ